MVRPEQRVFLFALMTMRARVWVGNRLQSRGRFPGGAPYASKDHIMSSAVGALWVAYGPWPAAANRDWQSSATVVFPLISAISRSVFLFRGDDAGAIFIILLAVAVRRMRSVCLSAQSCPRERRSGPSYANATSWRRIARGAESTEAASIITIIAPFGQPS